MPDIWETYQSRDQTAAVETGGGSRAEKTYIVSGTNDDATALALAQATIPGGFNALVLEDVRLRQIGPSHFEAIGSYKDPDEDDNEKPDPGEVLVSFDTTGATHRVTQSIETVHALAPAGKTAPDFKGAIGVNGDIVDGVDVVTPSLKITYTTTLSNATVTDAYIRTLARMTGTVNLNTWKGYDPGELLFLGASGTQRNSGDPQVTFHFVVSPNETNIEIGDDITVLSKLGHDYLWVFYKPNEDVTAKQIVQQPAAAYVEQVYEYKDFTALGIGS